MLYKLIEKKGDYFKVPYSIINTETNQTVLEFFKGAFLGCCGTTVLGGFSFVPQRMKTDSKVAMEAIGRLMLSTVGTNNALLTDVVMEDDRIQEIIELLTPDIKPIDSYFNENSGNTVIIYSYTKCKAS